jgi:hypothetical protein
MTIGVASCLHFQDSLGRMTCPTLKKDPTAGCPMSEDFNVQNHTLHQDM